MQQKVDAKMKKKHIFLTGKIQVGKSTLVQSVLSDLKKIESLHLEYDGFRTYFDERWNEERNLCIERVLADPEIKKEMKCLLHFEGGPIFETLAYETNGVEVLEQMDTRKLLIFDECGKFEKDSPRFLAKLREILDGDTHVFGVLRKDPQIEWLQEIAARQDVEIYEVTEENRDVLREELKNRLLELLENKEDDKTITEMRVVSGV